jgi:hypothetical protein
MHYHRARKGTDLTKPKGWRPQRGPYKGRSNAKDSYADRLAEREKPQPLCACGCGELTPWQTSKARWSRYVKGHYRRQHPYKDPDWLRREYADKQRTADDIARDFGVNGKTIVHWMRLHGIPRRSQAESLRISGGAKGASNPAWRGGTTPERQRTYKTQEWRDVVKAVYARDNYRCVRCGHHQDHAEHALHAHHIAPWAKAPELRTDMDNLVTLCARCHRWVHSKRNTKGEYLRE